MTTEQRMRTFPFHAILLACLLLPLTGCQTERFGLPQQLVAPYSAAAERELLWAVLPLQNESGTSVVDPDEVADTLTKQLNQTRGVAAVPLNRSRAVMRELGLSAITSPADALRVGQALGVDAVLIGSITAWDPYDPLQLGLSVALIGITPAMGGVASTDNVDPRALSAAGSDYTTNGTSWRRPSEPLSVASAHFDGADHEIQIAARAYAEGRFDENTSLSWRRYLRAMPLFTDFAAFALTNRLLDSERIRLAKQERRADAR